MNRFAINPLFSKLLIASLVLMVSWILFMRFETRPFSSDEIMKFEFAGTQEKVSAILDVWEMKQWIPLAKHFIYLDFIFIFLYSASLALGCLTIPALTGKFKLINWGMKLYRFGFYAGLADFLENICLLEILYGEGRAFFPSIAWVLALVKFIIIGGVLLFLFRCIIFFVVSLFHKN
jgi:hypothetical protein